MKTHMAVAYAVRKRAKEKKMARGGEVMNEKLNPEHEPEHSPMMRGPMSPSSIAKSIRMKKMAMGGEVESPEEEFMEPMMEDSEVDSELDSTHDIHEDPAMMKKGRIAKIMAGLHKKHFG